MRSNGASAHAASHHDCCETLRRLVFRRGRLWHPTPCSTLYLRILLLCWYCRPARASPRSALAAPLTCVPILPHLHRCIAAGACNAAAVPSGVSCQGVCVHALLLDTSSDDGLPSAAESVLGRTSSSPRCLLVGAASPWSPPLRSRCEHLCLARRLCRAAACLSHSCCSLCWCSSPPSPRTSSAGWTARARAAERACHAACPTPPLPLFKDSQRRAEVLTTAPPQERPLFDSRCLPQVSAGFVQCLSRRWAQGCSRRPGAAAPPLAP